MSSIQNLIGLARIPGGRREMALNRLLDRIADNPNLSSLEPPVRAAITTHLALTDLRHRYQAARSTAKFHAARARELDPVLDRCLSTLGGTLTGLARSLDLGSPLQVQAEELNDALFPSGVGAVTSLTYVNEHVAVNKILRTLHSAEVAGTVEALGLPVQIARLKEVNDEYGAVLTKPEDLTPARMKAEDDAAWQAYLSVVARIVGLFPTDAPEDEAQRTELLQPLLDQHEEHRLWRQRKAKGNATGTGDLEDLEEALAFDADTAPDQADTPNPEGVDLADADPAGIADPVEVTA